jgi:hypothetical protein
VEFTERPTAPSGVTTRWRRVVRQALRLSGRCACTSSLMNHRASQDSQPYARMVASCAPFRCTLRTGGSEPGWNTALGVNTCGTLACRKPQHNRRLHAGSDSGQLPVHRSLADIHQLWSYGNLDLMQAGLSETSDLTVLGYRTPV